MYVTLKCSSCDNIECKLGRYVIPDDSEEGCTREVTEEQAELLQHYQEEVLPFIPMYKNRIAAQDKLEEIYQFLSTIYSDVHGTFYMYNPSWNDFFSCSSSMIGKIYPNFDIPLYLSMIERTTGVIGTSTVLCVFLRFTNNVFFFL